MEIAGWRPDCAKATGNLEFGDSHPFSKWEASAARQGERETGENRVRPIVTVNISATLEGEIYVAVSCSLGNVTTRGQFSTVVTYMMPTQLNPGADVNFTTT